MLSLLNISIWSCVAIGVLRGASTSSVYHAITSHGAVKPATFTPDRPFFLYNTTYVTFDATQSDDMRYSSKCQLMKSPAGFYTNTITYLTENPKYTIPLRWSLCMAGTRDCIEDTTGPAVAITNTARSREYTVCIFPKVLSRTFDFAIETYVLVPPQGIHLTLAVPATEELATLKAPGIVLSSGLIFTAWITFEDNSPRSSQGMVICQPEVADCPIQKYRNKVVAKNYVYKKGIELRAELYDQYASSRTSILHLQITSTYVS